jgi:hypothetical protein
MDAPFIEHVSLEDLAENPRTAHVADGITAGLSIQGYEPPLVLRPLTVRKQTRANGARLTGFDPNRTLGAYVHLSACHKRRNTFRGTAAYTVLACRQR